MLYLFDVGFYNAEDEPFEVRVVATSYHDAKEVAAEELDVQLPRFCRQAGPAPEGAERGLAEDPSDGDSEEPSASAGAAEGDVPEVDQPETPEEGGDGPEADGADPVVQ